METREFEVKPLFAEPYMRTNISDVLTDEHEAFIKSVTYLPNLVNKITDDLYLLERPQLAPIKQAIQEAIDTYAREVMGVKAKIEITQSWALINEPGAGMHGHTHANSVVSGSFYFAHMPDPPGNLVFDRYSGYRQITIDIEEGRGNIYNALRNAVVPKRGDVILFNSPMQHYVENNLAQEPRYSLAFNAFPRGTIGNYRNVCELKL